MSTHVPGFQSFFRSFASLCVLAKLATSSIRDNTSSERNRKQHGPTIVGGAAPMAEWSKHCAMPTVATAKSSS